MCNAILPVVVADLTLKFVGVALGCNAPGVGLSSPGIGVCSFGRNVSFNGALEE